MFSLGVLLAMTAAHADAMEPDKFFQKTAPSVWRIFTYDSDGIRFAQGSAVAIGKETLLTNCHVLAKAKRFVIRKDNISYEAKLQHIDVERDLCQITARNLDAPAVPIGDSDKLSVGQRVFALGNPEGLELTLSDGLISALRQDEATGRKAIQISAPITHGSSGGGLFDEEGRLIGITSSGYILANLNFAIPINYLQELPARSAAALAKRSAPSLKAEAGQANATASRVAAGGSTSTADNPGRSGYADVNDLSRLAALSPRAREAYQRFLAKPFPRAFALTEHGGWLIAAGRKPRDPASSVDPAIRAVPDCEKRHQVRCYLYAVDDKVVWDPANVIEARDKAKPGVQKDGKLEANPDPDDADTVPQKQTQTVADSAPAPVLQHRAPVPPATGFAALNDVDAVPLVGVRGRELYREYLGWQPPKAIAISQKGAVARARNSADAMKLALENCEKYGSPCKLYAVDNNVVWVAGPSAANAPATSTVGTLPFVAAGAAPEAPKEHMFVKPAPSGFAMAADSNAIPFLAARGREGFKRYLTLKPPKAFAIGADGSWNFMTDDPRAMKTALERCEARGATCWLYAVDNDVVWREETAGRVRIPQLSSR
jgi:S1-C subfamily serine protease